MKEPLGSRKSTRGQFGSNRLIVYKPLNLITPEEANQLGIITEMPVFVTETTLTRKYIPEVLALNINYPPKSQYFYSQNGVFAFSELRTALDYESIDYYGVVPFSGFIAVGEAYGSFTRENIPGFKDECIKTEGIHILGIKAFAEETPIRRGYIEEVTLPDKVSLCVLPENKKSIFGAQSRLRYFFEVDQGEAIFSMLTPNMDHFLEGGN